MEKKRICVFCGSSPGKDPKYAQLASDLGQFLVEQNIDLVYGGSIVGLMGIIANTVIELGGEVYGVAPKVISELEIVHKNLHHLFQVETMHERKQKMYDLSDAFLAIPGGMGTWDELCEIGCWKQLQLHQKPVGILNAFNYYDPFLAQLDHSVNEGFTKEIYRDLIWVGKEIDDLYCSQFVFQA